MATKKVWLNENQIIAGRLHMADETKTEYIHRSEYEAIMVRLRELIEAESFTPFWQFRYLLRQIISDMEKL